MASLRESMSRLLSPKIEAVGLEVGTSALKVVELRGGNPPPPWRRSLCVQCLQA